jgi:geranylgeranyl reductase family protein
MHDVIVVGGGPGGLYSAYQLARAGCDVAVLEEHPTAGEPVHCTGVLASEAYDEFELPRGAILNTLARARFLSPSGRVVEYATATTEALVVDRVLFDRGLHERARNAGATLRLGARVTSIDVGAHSVVARTAEGADTRGRSCVLACGASYSLQRRLGLGLPPVFLQSAQMELPARHAGDVEVHFGQTVAPKGFAWVVPVRRADGPRARVGLMCDRHAARYFSELLGRVSAAWGLSSRSGENAGAPRHKLLPLAPIRRTYTDRLVAVGDAAGLVKATTGGGIYYSLVSAAIAADVLAEALHRDQLGAGTLEQYEARWRRRLGPELRAQLALRMLAQRLTDSHVEALFELACTDGVMPIVRRTARFNHHRDLILSLLKHPPVRRVLFRHVVGKNFAFSVR